MRAWLDTSGPGILVDTFNCNFRLPMIVDNQIDMSVILSVTARNTGTTKDQFRLSLDAPPLGWWSKEMSLALQPGIDTRVNLEVHAPLGTPPSIKSLKLNAISLTNPSVKSTTPIVVAVGNAQGTVPQVALVAPTFGSIKGMSELGVVGVNLSKTTNVLVGGQPANAFKILSDGLLHVVTPPGKKGKTSVQVVLSDGQTSQVDARSAFTYVNPQPALMPAD